MNKLKIKSLDELKKVFLNYGYFPTEEILIEAYLALQRLGQSVSRGQDIYSICLDGPAGAGKSSFISVYKYVIENYFDEEIEVVEYQCNKTTGSNELIEDVGMVAVVIKDEKKIIIPGAIVKAIQKVREGKKVILFLDEFDKSREETDVFFYGLLQSGKINTVQLGNMEIEPEYKSNLQVFFCKNDFRDLTGPLSRRTRTLNLDYMEPSLFYKVAENSFKDMKDQSGITSLINLITLIYDFAYQNKNKFDRLPAPSEMLITIEDTYLITQNLSIEGKSMYGLIFRRMFKDEDSFQTFESLISNTTEEEYEGLRKYLSELKETEEEVSSKSLLESMSKKVFESVISEKEKELDKKIKEYSDKIEERMNLRRDESTHEISTIKLNGGNLVLNDDNSMVIRNFYDSTEYIKRADSVFNSINNANWTRVASMSFIKNNHKQFAETLISVAPQLDYKIYEDGVLLNSGEVSLAANAVLDANGNVTYNFFTSTQVVPSNVIRALRESYLDTFSTIMCDNPFDISIDALIYNDVILPLNQVLDNVYALNVKVNTLLELNQTLESLELVCEDNSKVLESCIEMMDNFSKKLKKEG